MHARQDLSDWSATGYHHRLWWFELVDMLHKLTLVALLAFMDKEVQVDTRTHTALHPDAFSGSVWHGGGRLVHHLHISLGTLQQWAVVISVSELIVLTVTLHPKGR